MDNGSGCYQREEELGLLDGLLEGDRRAGRRFFNRFNSTIEMSVRRVLRRSSRRLSEEDVRDAVSDVWLMLLEDDKRPLRRFDPEREIRVATWIGLVARNRTIDRLRGANQRRETSSDDHALTEAACPRPLPCEALEEHQRRELVAHALGLLRPQDRAFLEEWYCGERSPEELAADYGISVGTVYTRRFKIQAKLARAVSRVARGQRHAHCAVTLH
jgi:RNA polymerase sigma-70 factor (ECF subfamily)